MVRVVLGTFSCNTGDGGCGSIESQNMVVNGGEGGFGNIQL